MKSTKGLPLILFTVLTLVACSDEPKKYVFENGVMGEGVVGTTPQESVVALKNGEKPKGVGQEQDNTENVSQTNSDGSVKTTRTPLKGLSDREQKVITTVDYFYQHLMNSEFDKIDSLIVPEKIQRHSYGEYYKAKLEDNNILLLDFKVDRISDKNTEFIIEVDIEQVVDKQVITYRDSLTLTQSGDNWLIDTIETDVK